MDRTWALSLWESGAGSAAAPGGAAKPSSAAAKTFSCRSRSASTSLAPLLALWNGVRKIVGRADVRDDWAKQGAVPMTMNPDEFTRYMNADIEKWARIVKISGAKADQ